MRILHLATTDLTPDGGLWAATEAQAATGVADHVLTNLNSGFGSMLSSVRLAHILRHEQPRIVRAYSEKDLLTAVRGKNLASPDTTPIIEFAPLLPPHPSPILAQSLNETDVIVFTSQEASERFLDRCPDAPANKFRIISCAGIDKPASASDIETPRIMAALTPLTPDSGITELVDFFIRNSKDGWRLRIGGEGKGRIVMPLIRRCRSSQVDVEWCGAVDDLSSFFAGVSLAVDPRREPLLHNSAIATASSLGIPVAKLDELTTSSAFL